MTYEYNCSADTKQNSDKTSLDMQTLVFDIAETEPREVPNKEPLYSAPLVTALLPEVDLDLKLAPHVYTAQMGEKGRTLSDDPTAISTESGSTSQVRSSSHRRRLQLECLQQMTSCPDELLGPRKRGYE